MCGFAGEIGHRVQPRENAEAITATLEHRGPDAAGYAAGQSWWLGFRRLAILDLTDAGAQPMSARNGRYWLAFNGEIYNYRELSADLVAGGVTLRGTSDTEVLINLLVRHGADAIRLLNGMFSFVFIDTQEQCYIMARDRLGVKPLYFTQQNGTLRFASELKALLAWPDAAPTLERSAIRDYLSLGYLPGCTPVFTGYRRLPPGCLVTGKLHDPDVEPRRYWQLRIEPKPHAGPDLFEELAALLTDAVRIRLRSDVKLGLFLSGGIDSGLVAAMAGKLGERLLAITVGFEEESFDETALAARTADSVGLEHKTIFQRQPSLEDVDSLARVFDEPFGDPSALPTMLLCSAAAAEATVFLSGDGGDEAFGGYRRYVEARKLGWLTRLPPPIARQVRSASAKLPVNSRLRYKLVKATLPDETMAAVFDGQGLLADPALVKILPEDLKSCPGEIVEIVRERWSRSSHLDLTSRQRQLDYDLYLPDDVLVKVDRASMANSIEVRSPFLDYRLVEWASRLPQNALVAGQGKMLLRSLARSFLPPQVVDAPKTGFGVPVGKWFREPRGHQWIRERLLESPALSENLWDRAGVEELLRLHLAEKRDFGDFIWRLAVLEAWVRHYVCARPPMTGHCPPSRGMVQ